MDKVIEQLRDLKNVKPREDWAKRNRDLLMSQITSQAPEKQSSFLNSLYFTKMFVPTRFLNFVAKPIGVVSVIIVMALGGGAMTVSASKDSLPGNILYPVKLTSERVKVSLTVSEDKKVQLHVTNAEERVREIAVILESDDDAGAKNKKITTASDNLKRQMEDVKESLDVVRDQKVDKEKNEQSMEMVKEVDQKVEVLSQKLQVTIDDISVDNEVVQIIDDAQDSVDEVGVKTVEVIVEKFDKGEVDLTSEEVFSAVEKKMNLLADKIADVQFKEDEIAQQEDVDADVLIEEEATDLQDTTDLPTGQAGTTEVIVEEEENEELGIKNDAEEKEQVVIDSENAKATLEEAVALLNSGDLASALEKMKEGNDMTEGIQVVVEAKISEREVVEIEEEVVVPLIEVEIE